ncbi:MAG: hypothetical protein RR515_04460 [Clostridium sp.]
MSHKGMVDKVQCSLAEAERKMSNAAEKAGDKMVNGVQAMESGLDKAEDKLRNLEGRIK